MVKKKRRRHTLVFAPKVTPGKYTLHEHWGIGTTHPCFFCRGASAEFAPQPQYYSDNYWFQAFKPFSGTATKDFGFQVTIKLVPEAAVPQPVKEEGKEKE
ncbi:MAG: hypothetical protein K2R98_23535 [Gemmataceae bacterium]|nr:hypothetical protein [Gemmataceae bacterium]